MSEHDNQTEMHEDADGYTTETGYATEDQSDSDNNNGSADADGFVSDEAAEKKKKLTNLAVAGIGAAVVAFAGYKAYDMFLGAPPAPKQKPIVPLAPQPAEEPQKQADPQPQPAAPVAVQEPAKTDVPAVPAAPVNDPFTASQPQQQATDPFNQAATTPTTQAAPVVPAAPAVAPTAPVVAAAPVVEPAAQVTAPVAQPAVVEPVVQPAVVEPVAAPVVQAPVSEPIKEESVVKPLDVAAVPQEEVVKAVDNLNKRMEALEKNVKDISKDGPAMRAIATLKKRMDRLEAKVDAKLGADPAVVAPVVEKNVQAQPVEVLKDVGVSKKKTAADRDMEAKKIMATSTDGEIFVKEEKKAKKVVEMVTERPYSLQAVIPGRLWVKTEDGASKTFIEGESLPDGSRILKIDAEKGIVKLNNGILQ